MKNHNNIKRDDYSFIEWRLLTLREIDMDGVFSESGQWFLSFEYYISLGITFFFIIIPLVVYGLFFDVHGLSDIDTWKPAVTLVALLIMFCVIWTLALLGQYLLLPCIGRMAHDFGCINEDELQIILRRHYPRSFLLLRKPHTILWKRIDVGQQDNSEEILKKHDDIPKISHWAAAADYAFLFSCLLFPAPIVFILGIIALRDCQKHALRGADSASLAIIFGLVFSLLFAWLLIDVLH